MNTKIKRMVLGIVVLALVFMIAIPMTSSFSVMGKAFLHISISLGFLIYAFSIWSSFKNANRKKIIASGIWLITFYLGLKFAIPLVSFLPVTLKGFAHGGVVLLFLGLFLYIWRKEE